MGLSFYADLFIIQHNSTCIIIIGVNKKVHISVALTHDKVAIIHNMKGFISLCYQSCMAMDW